jgi:SAM-dependent methyltransferase
MSRKNNSYEFDQFREKKREAKLLDHRAASNVESVVPTLKRAGLRVNMRVLEVGSGTGRRAVTIANFLSGGEIVGVDNSDELLKLAKKTLPAAKYKNLSFLKVDVLDGKRLASLGRFDFIHLRLVIQHLSRPIEVLRRLKFSLRAGGVLFIEDTDRDWMEVMPAPKKWPEIYAKMKAGQRKNGDPNSGRKLGYYLDKAGLKDVSVALIPVCGGSKTTLNWVRNYAPSYINFLQIRDVAAAKRVLRDIEKKAKKGNVFFYQTWFQAHGRR